MLLRLLVLSAIFSLLYYADASCKTSEYCPLHWDVLRRTDQSAWTCDPMSHGQPKCPKPYTCIHSKCGLSFCCGQQLKLKQWKEQKEMEEEMRDSQDDDEL